MNKYNEIHMQLLHAVTEHDRKQAGNRFHNPYALALYCAALERVDDKLKAGADLESTLYQEFNDRLLDVCLKAVGLPTQRQKTKAGAR
jgi:hypothetical protein